MLQLRILTAFINVILPVIVIFGTGYLPRRTMKLDPRLSIGTNVLHNGLGRQRCHPDCYYANGGHDHSHDHRGRFPAQICGERPCRDDSSEHRHTHGSFEPVNVTGGND
jgi:hypothetical protein